MKTDELAELLLTVLAEQNGEGSHLLDALAGPLGITDRAKIREAAVSLKGQGLADVFVSLTGTDARITATGRKFVCEGGRTGVIQRYRENGHCLSPFPRAPTPRLTRDEVVSYLAAKDRGASC